MTRFYEEWPELKRNPLYVGGLSYGGLYGPRLAYAIHTSLKDINLQGVINSNGILDYRYDPYVSTTEALLNFGLIPLSMQETYEKNHCHIEWFDIAWNNLQRPRPSALCLDLFLKAWALINYSNIYDLLHFADQPINPALTV
jgi:carboxypeptidase C (cathepsin A)